MCDWESYALLRDNVQHFLEGGEPSVRFPALHAIERAVDNGQETIDAARLRGEVLLAWCSLWNIELEHAAISLRTRAFLTGGAPQAEVRGTLSARSAGWPLPLRGRPQAPIPGVAWRFILTVLTLTETAVDGDTIDVCCIGEKEPNIARATTA
jgi:hypothetical protein